MSALLRLLSRDRPYSPHLNPIEEAFTEVKAYVRRHHIRATSSIQEGLAVIRDGLLSVSAEHARSFIRHAGYKIDD